MAETCSITAVFPLYQRLEEALKTLKIIKSCHPRPAEIMVCIDGADSKIIRTLQEQHPDVELLMNPVRLGPGGSRNRLFAAAKHELIASFDDDSFPAHEDFFERATRTAERFPSAATISAASHPSEWESPHLQRIAIPSGCGCIIRKSWFAKTQGYVPLTIAYSMEEVDAGLQIHAIGGEVIHDPHLRVIHDHSPLETVDPLTNATVLANTALFPALRFPIWLWPVGCWQVARRLGFLVRNQWFAGLLRGLVMIPQHIRSHWGYRKVMPGRAVLSWLWLRYRPVVIMDEASDAASTSAARPDPL